MIKIKLKKTINDKSKKLNQNMINKGGIYMVIMVTGGAGFIGSNFIRYWLDKYDKDTVINVDILTYAGVIESLTDVVDKHKDRYKFYKESICDYNAMEKIVKENNVDTIVNFAAESHNSYAIINPTAFFQTNVIGTQTLAEVTRKNNVKRFHHISTCEVFGDMELNSKDAFTENSPYYPNTPYNAAKAGGDLAVKSYIKTYNLPATISNCSNNYGPYQFPEKLIPVFISKLVNDKPLTLYKESENKREWLHVIDHCRAIDMILKNGRLGETYNIGSGIEKSVEEISDVILKVMDKSSEYKTYIPSRPSHDKRYLLDSSKLRNELGWKPVHSFDDGIKETIEWYVNNRQWWEPLMGRVPFSEGSW